AAEMPGRMEPVSRSPLVLIDGAHNVEGLDTLVSALREEVPTTRWQLVFGAMGDKDVPHMLEQLAPLVGGLVVTAVHYSRAGPPPEAGPAPARRRSPPSRRPGCSTAPYLPPLTSATPWTWREPRPGPKVPSSSADPCTWWVRSATSSPPIELRPAAAARIPF